MRSNLRMTSNSRANRQTAQQDRYEWPLQPPTIPAAWKKKFATRRDIDYTVENARHVDNWADLQGFESAEDYELRSGEKNAVLQYFMRSSNDPEDYESGIEPFCTRMSLWRLMNEKQGQDDDEEEDDKISVAWLDERSFKGGKMRSRPHRGPLKARQLYMELKKPRFANVGPAVPNRTRAKNQHRVPTVSPPSQDNVRTDIHPDADRRLIFITNPDEWIVYALIGTASHNQVSALRDCLNKYVEFEALIDVTFSPIGLQTFQLSFHLPYYAWRSSAHAYEDHRRDRNANPLRQTIDVSYLNIQNPSDKCFLYESQISCVIAGPDRWRWVAYGFVDTRFDTDPGKKESVYSIHEDLISKGAHMDPFTRGELEAEHPIQDPMEYFLKVFRIRLLQVRREWKLIVKELRKALRAYEQETHQYSGNPRDMHPSTQHNDPSSRNTVEKSRDWVVQTSKLSRKLYEDLRETVDACKDFLTKKSFYFRSLSRSHESLSGIQSSLIKLEKLEKKIHSLADNCERLSKGLELQLVLETVNIRNNQYEVAQHTRGLSVIMLVSLAPFHNLDE
ncbi:hypothetical protein QQS21_004628 [Conoideocrella luteorostrata]|uniref:Uncharacterized protein n=1 Tax=Conoideocrella luteorostrata TaxID=1105319 RepID=A0AAJ0FZR2_9HYPO|nr:hypothetical protein QQS21_004628 [Conoideocrella luteorostrata]